MSKLTRKFLLGATVILAVVACLSIYVNANFVERYFLYQEKQELNRICDQLVKDGEQLEEMIRELEERENVVIARVTGTEDNETLNQRIRQAFLDKGIGLKKYWLWEEDQQDAMEQGRKTRLYRQEKLNYSLLVEYVSQGDSFMAAAMMIPSMERTLALMNRVTAAVFLGAVCLMMFFLSILLRRITRPLEKIRETAKAISSLDFQKVEIHTGDELEFLADDMNRMSDNLEEAQRTLNQKNRQMEELLSNVSHDLKTPVALIKAYGRGMQDGLDDGTFLDTILEQNSRMEAIIEQLLHLSRVQQKQMKRETVTMSEPLKRAVEEYRICAEERGMTIRCGIEEALTADTVEESVRMIYENLLSNAVKYGAGGEILVRLYHTPDGRCCFQVENQVEKGREPDLERIWQPFYVGEESRSRDMSGTGLGLTMVRAAAEKAGCRLDCRIEDGRIIFSVIF